MPNTRNPLIPIDTPYGVADAATGELIAPLPISTPAVSSTPTALPPLPVSTPAATQQTQAAGPTISRQRLIDLAEQDQVKAMSGPGQREWLRRQAESLASIAPEPVDVTQMERALQQQYAGLGYNFEAPSLLESNLATQTLRNIPSIGMRGVAALGDVLGGGLAIADSYLPGSGETFLGSPLSYIAQAGSNTFRAGADQIRDAAAAIESDVSADARQRVEELIAQDRTQDLLEYIITDPAGQSFAFSVVGESLIPFSVLSRARQVMTAGGTAASAITRGQQAVEAGLISSLIGAGQTAADLADDGPLTAAQGAGSLAVGGATGALTGLAARLGPTPEAVLRRLTGSGPTYGRAALQEATAALVNSAPPAARATPSAWRAYVTGVVGGSALEGSSEAAQEWIQALVQSGYDSNGAWDPSLFDYTNATNQAALGGAIGALGGAASGAFDTAGNRRAAAEAQASVLPVDEAAQETTAPVDTVPFSSVTGDGSELFNTMLARDQYLAVQRALQASGEDIDARSNEGARAVQSAHDALAAARDQEPADSATRTAYESDRQIFQSLLEQEAARAEQADQQRRAQASETSAASQQQGTRPQTLVDPTSLAADPTFQQSIGPLDTELRGLFADQFGLPQPGNLDSGVIPIDPQGRARRPTGEPVAEFLSDQVQQYQNAQSQPTPLSQILVAPGQLPAPGQSTADTISVDTQGQAALPQGIPYQGPSLQEILGTQSSPAQLPAPGQSQADVIPVDSRGRGRLPVGEPITETVSEQVQQQQQAQAAPAAIMEAGPSGVRLNSVAQAAADDPLGLPPLNVLADDVWQTAQAKRWADMARQLYNADPDTTVPRQLVIQQLDRISRAAVRPDGSELSPSSRTFRDAQRANDLLEALRRAEEIAPVPEEARVDFRETRDLPAGKLPAGDDATLLHHVDFGAFLERGDIAGALRWARDNLTSSTNKLLAPLTFWAQMPEVALRVQLEDSPATINGHTREAWYTPDTSTIHITRRSAGTPYYLLHEVVHGLTENAIQDPTLLSPAQQQALDLMYGLYEEARDLGTLPEYATSSLSEFVAEAWSNPDVQSRMQYKSNVPGVSQLHNVYRAFVNTVRRLLGIQPGQQSALESIASASYALSSSAQKYSRTPEVQVNYTMAHAYRRDASGKKMIVAVLAPTDTGVVTITYLDGRPQRIADSLADAVLDVQREPGVRVSELSRLGEQDIGEAQSIFNADTLSPLAKAGKNFIARTLTPISPALASSVGDALVSSMRFIKQKLTNRMAMLQELQTLTGEPIFDQFLTEQSRQRARYSREAGDIASTVAATDRALQRIGSNTQRFGDYLYALHVNERNRLRGQSGRDASAFSFEYNGQRYTNTSGTAEEATRLVSQFSATLSPQEREVFSRMGKQWRQIMDDMLDAERDIGLYDQDTYMRLGGRNENGERSTNAYRYYVPLLTESRTGRAIPGAGVVGRDTTAANPYESLYRQMVQRSNRLAHMTTRKNLMELLRKHPLPDLATVDTVRVTWDADGNPSVVSDTDNIRNRSIYVPDQGGWKRILVKDGSSQGRSLLAAFNSNPYDEQANRFMSVSSNITRILAASNTTYSVPFALKAMVWDATTTLFNFQGAFDRNLSTIQAYKLSLQSFRNAVTALGREGLGLAEGRASQTDPLITLFNQLGGGVNVGASADGAQMAAQLRRYSGTSIDQVRRNPLTAARAVAGRTLNTLGEVLHSPSQALRFGAFKSYLEYAAKRTFGPGDMEALQRWMATPEGEAAVRRAVIGSKELSGNFELRGSGQLMPTFFAFWNAAMQGTRLFASMATTTQGLSGMAGLMLLGAFSALSAIDDPDDDDPDGGSRYARSRDRLQNVLIDPRSGAQVPVAYELRVPYVFGSSMALALTGERSPSQAFFDVVSAARDMFLPLSAPGTVDEPFNVAYAVSPTAVQVGAYPLLLGRDAFGRQIDPPVVRNLDGSAVSNPSWAEQTSYRSYPSLNELTRWLWQTTDGAIDWSPTRLSVFADNVFGSAGRFITASMSTPNPEVGFTDVPAVQQLTRTFRHRRDPFAMQDEYNDLQQQVETSMRFLQQSSDAGSFDLLNSSRTLSQAQNINSRLQRQVRNIRIDGLKPADLRQALADARANGNEAAQVQAETQMRKYYEQRDQLLGQALVELRKLEEGLR